ncbi:MAG TPA: hypothetical protein VJ765_00415, partial [Chitinophagaceae bacterium]|nr:hypothetical protein [Chitinophagaceae bacterium]
KKNILAVILLAAAGGRTYYLFQEKNSDSNFKQEQILGKWKLDLVTDGKDSLSLFTGIMGMIDSNLLQYDYDFTKEGIVVKLLKDSVQKDITHYEWRKDNHLLWKEQGDSIGQTIKIITLNNDSLVLKTNDSVSIFFKKAK